MGDVMLEIQELSLRFGGLSVLSNVNMRVDKGTIHSIIGPNGAGKSSLLNCISGFYSHYKGSISYQGVLLKNKKPHVIAALGIGRVFQEIELFQELSVIENILLGRHGKFSYHLFNALLFDRKARREERQHRRFCEALAKTVGLTEVLERPVGELPYGTQKKVGLARALAMEPALLLLDEPMAGMTKEEKAQLVDVLRSIRRDMGITMIVIEHDLSVVMNLSDRVSVLNFGQKIAEGTPSEVQNDELVIEAYIGRKQEKHSLEIGGLEIGG